MYVARLLYPVKVLGPGKRIGIWFNGCKHACKGCSNPELWELRKEYKTSNDVIKQLADSVANSNFVEGFTLTGGDPFEQPEALLQVLKYINQINSDVIVYTGYKYEEIKEKHSEILKYISVLIDGPYVEDMNDNSFLRGSSNQNIIILKDEYRDKYESYIRDGKNEIQNFSARDSVISVGIHRKGYERNLEDIVKKMRLEEIYDE